MYQVDLIELHQSQLELIVITAWHCWLIFLIRKGVFVFQLLHRQVFLCAMFDLHSLLQGFFLEYRVEVLVDFCFVAVVITGLAV